MNILDGQIAIVTGSGRGIGRAIALKLASAGADVVCVARTEKNVTQVSKEITAMGRRSWAFWFDVSNSDEVTKFCEKVLSEIGKVDILVNNAGVTRDNLLIKMNEDDWDYVLDTNLKSVFLLTRCLIRHFIKQRAGRIVNISSIAGIIGNAGQCNYSASKAGIIGFSKSLAREVASRNITVNVVAPGFIDTEMTAILPESIKREVLAKIPLGRFGDADDVAEAVLFLSGPGAKYITGQVLTVDGGLAI